LLSDYLHPYRLFRRFFLDVWAAFDKEVEDRCQNRTPGQRTSDTLLVFYILVISVASLVLQEYLGSRTAFTRIVDFIDNPLSQSVYPFLYSLVGWIKPDEGSFWAYISQNGYYELWSLSYWASWRIFGFLVIPALAVAIHPRLRKMQLGLTFKGMTRHLWIYLLLFIPVLVCVIIVSFSKEFSTYYPFYVHAHRSLFDFAVWETFYVLQFLSLEFFFRGFMIQPLRRIMGTSAIFAMVIPYVMIHIGKPMVECFAAIIAGVVLGTLAMRTRSIWSGFLIHVSVALSMDLMAIWQVHWR
jgi:CAAX protease family protein